MSKYLIEVPHEDGELACLRAIQIFLETGSHFLANADWGCQDGEHKAWIIAEVATKEEARFCLPPAFRSRAKIIGLNKFSLGEINEYLRPQKD